MAACGSGKRYTQRAVCFTKAKGEGSGVLDDFWGQLPGLPVPGLGGILEPLDIINAWQCLPLCLSHSTGFIHVLFLPPSFSMQLGELVLCSPVQKVILVPGDQKL